MAEYSKLAKGSFTATAAAAQVVNLPFVPDVVELFNYTAYVTPAQNNIPHAYWDVDMGQGYAVYEFFNATPVLTTAVFTSNGVSSFEGGLINQFGAQKQVAAITKASPAVVTITSHGYSTGDVVMFSGLKQSSTTGMQQIAGIPFTITVSDANTFSIPWNTNQSSFTAISGSPSGAYARKVLYPYLYAPGTSVITAITVGTTTTIDTTTAHNLVAGQQVAFRIPSDYGTTELNSLPNDLVPGRPAYGYVQSVTDSNTVVIDIDSSAYTAFDSNQTFASATGLSFPEIVAVGDLNTGGIAYSGGVYYPSPSVNGVTTINGPAINGAFVNNTRRGFIVGAAAAAPSLTGDTSDVIYWKAYAHDYY
jgi:hypothetical protein